MTLVSREAQKLAQSKFFCMIIPVSMFLLDSDEGKVKYSPLYGRGSKVTILVRRHFQSEMLPLERVSKKTLLGHIFVKNWRPNQKRTFLAGLPYPPQRGSSRSLNPRVEQKLAQSRFSCMLIYFSMVLLASDEGKVKYSLLYGRESKVTILVGRHFQSEMLPLKRASKKTWLGHIFVRINDLTKSPLFWWAHSTPLSGSSMTLVLREAQKLAQSTFSCMLIPFSMFLLESDEGKVKYSPLYGRGRKVTILVGRHFQSEMLMLERVSKNTWLGNIFVRIW